MEFDTGSNESHHKLSKIAARLTQRCIATFDFQTATRLIEFLALDIAMCELDQDRCLWEYFDGVERTVDAAAEVEDFEDIVGDMRDMSMEGTHMGSRSSAEPSRSITEQFLSLCWSVEDEQTSDDESEATSDQSVASRAADQEANATVPDLAGDGSETSDDDESESDDDDSVSDDEMDAETPAPDPEPEELIVKTGGTKIRVFEDEDKPGESAFQVLGRAKSADDTTWMPEVVDFLFELMQIAGSHLPKEDELIVLTEHRRGKHMFRGHPNFQGSGKWRDWALINWQGNYGTLPAHIYCFVQLPPMPSGSNTIEFGGIDLAEGTYAVVESTKYDAIEDASKASDLFTPITVETIIDTSGKGQVKHRRLFFLADVRAIVGPCIVVPDIGGPKNAYFQVKNRSAWAKEFEDWLKLPHTDDIMHYPDADPVAEEGNNGGKRNKTAAKKN